MSLSFPKHVVIVNKRLSWLYYSCMLVTFVVLASAFFGFEQYSKKVPLAGHVKVNLWPTGIVGSDSLQRLQSVTQENLQKPFCQKAHEFDFWWDSSRKYSNHTCATFCMSPSQTNCLSSLDAFVDEGPDQILLTTQVQKTFVPRLMDGKDLQTQNFFVPSTEALGIGFAYSFDLPSEKIHAKNADWILGKPKNLAGSSRKNVLTVMVDHEGKPIKVKKPDNANIELTVPELLKMAGKPDWLDSLGEHENTMPGARLKTGPLMRISGATLALEVTCHDSHRGDVEHLLGGSWVGPACYVSAHDGNRWYPWSSASRREPTEDAGGAKGDHLYVYHGLRVVAKGDGEFTVIDINNTYHHLVSFMVLMGLPKVLVLFFAVTFLGHFSKIYKGVIMEEFSIFEQVAGMATRLMSTSATFVDLEQGAAGENGEHCGIPKGRMRERLREALKHRGGKLDKKEVESFVNFCFRAVSSNNVKKKVVRPTKSFLIDALGGACEHSEENHSDHIDIDCFSKACSSLDKIKFEAVVKLFDRDRRVFALEHFFMPPYMRKYLTEVDAARVRGNSEYDLETGISSLGVDLGFEKAVAPMAFGKGADAEQPVLQRVPSVELTQHLGKHLEKFSRMVDAKEIQHLTLEQKRNLPQVMLEALRDLITREQVTHHKVGNEGRRLQEFESQLAKLREIQQTAKSEIPEQMKEVEERLQGQMVSVQEQLLKEMMDHMRESETKAEQSISNLRWATLQSTVEGMRKDLATTKEVLGQSLEEISELRSASNRTPEPTPRGPDNWRAACFTPRK